MSLQQKYDQLNKEILTLGFTNAMSRLHRISQVIGSPDRTLEETLFMYQYAHHLIDYCQTFLEVNETPPKVVLLDQSRSPTMLRDLDTS